jgi:hypothetical protein
VASQRQLEEMAARCGVSRAQDLLVAAEKLADEFGETVVLEAVMAALERRLAGSRRSDSDFGAIRERHPESERHSEGERARESHPAYAHLDESRPVVKEAASSGSAAYAGRHDQAAPGRVSFRSLLAGRRSSEELIDEDKALANCKPLSTAVLSVSRENPRTSRFAPRSTPASPRPRSRQDGLRAPMGDAATSARSSRLSSSLAGSSAGPNSGSSDDAV